MQAPCSLPNTRQAGLLQRACRAAADDMGTGDRRGSCHPFSGHFSVRFCPSFLVMASARGPVPKGCPVSLGGKGR